MAEHIIQGRLHLEANILQLSAHLLMLHHHDVAFLLSEVSQSTCVYLLHDLGPQNGAFDTGLSQDKQVREFIDDYLVIFNNFFNDCHLS